MTPGSSIQPPAAATKSYEAFLQEELRDPELAAAYLTAALAEGSTEEFLLALRSVADAHGGIGAVAEAADLNRQTLYRTLSGHGNPTIATLLGVLRALGLNLAFTPAAPTP
jgi:probable addiction module antidote protein